MAGLFQGIGTMTGALRAFQDALNVTGNNVSNVNTAGYNRQVIQYNQNPSTQDFGGILVGNGVSIYSVSRVQNQFLFAQQVQSNSEIGRTGTLLGGLNNVQSVMNEPGGAGISDAMNQFFNAWSALGSSPSNDSLKMQLQQAAQTLTSRVRGMYTNLQAQNTQTGSQITSTIQQAQQLSNQIAELNKQILAQETPNGQPNDLLDARDEAIQQLSQIMPIKVQAQDNGTVSLFSGQLTLVDQSGAKTLPTSFDASTGTLSDGALTYNVTGGSLLGLFQTSQKISSYEGQLDTLANTMRTQVNAIYQTATDPSGATGNNFFNDSNPQTGAIDFDLDASVKGDYTAIATGASGNAGDGGIALSISSLQSTQLAALGGLTFSGYYASVVSGVGQDVATTQNQSNTASAIGQQVSNQVQSISGVSLDDEMANMLRYQRSYQVAAKTLSLFDQTTEDLINILH